MAHLYSNLCLKCNGHMYLNQDDDLQCIICGKILVRTVRRNYDSRAGKIRDNKKKKVGSNLDGHSKVGTRRVRSSSASNNDSTLVRQRGMGAVSYTHLTLPTIYSV